MQSIDKQATYMILKHSNQWQQLPENHGADGRQRVYMELIQQVQIQASTYTLPTNMACFSNRNVINLPTDFTMQIN